jgi:acetyl-CoA carboxylase carboxyl transferase subunit beta
MNWLLNDKTHILNNQSKNRTITNNFWNKCQECSTLLSKIEINNNFMVCPKCSYHMRINARTRIKFTLDPSSKQYEIASNITPKDILSFKDTKLYTDRLKAANVKSNETDALVVINGTINKYNVVLAVFEFNFLGGSMGSVVGERFLQGINNAIKNNIPFICITSSGGARMQESLFSLMQMSKVSAALAKLHKHKLPYIVVLTDPTTGGVSASLAMLGDIHIAEPNALICFAGPRVIEQTVRETLPEGFQRSEFLLEKGMVDMIVDRRNLRNVLTSIIEMLTYKK